MSEQSNPSADALPAPAGFLAGGVKAGLKRSGALDLAAIVSDRPAVAAAVTTRNLFPGAPVVVTRERIAGGRPVRGVIVNAGISNVCTGSQGLADAYAMAGLAAEAIGAAPEEFLVASTGVIGRPLPMEKLQAATPDLMRALTRTGWADFSRAIMTTDLVPKIAHRTLTIHDGDGLNRTATILGICKGSGMIEPNMATMLAFIATDYALDAETATQMMQRVTERTFNCVTVDGDTSTSDMAILLANGAAVAREELTAHEDAHFEQALGEVCEELARAIARDGEGATHLVIVEVEGAASETDARRVAKTIANSPLVKTAIFGHDPNWGRICAAAGRAGVAFDAGLFHLRVQGTPLMERGMPLTHDAAALSQALRAPEVLIQVTLGTGPAAARVWTCDLTYDYVKINAEYTT